jgi:outer membrane protein assembly factor BamB
MNLNAQDWSQWRGPNRDGVLKTTGLNLNWAEKKPALLWVFRQAGAGYSAPVIVGTTLYCQGAADGSDFAFALDIKTGNLKWKQSLGAEYIQNDERGNGPRGSVTVDGDKLYLIRGGGQIHCLSAINGKMLWQKDFRSDFSGKLMSNWGFSESPLVDGNLVICTPGGSGGTMIALDKNTGNTVWQSKEWTDEAGYSSPIVIEADGIRQYVQQSSKGVAGVSAKDGKLLWRVEVPGYRTAIIPTPLNQDNIVYVTASYNSGSTCLRITKEGEGCKAETVYSNKNMVNQHGGVVLMNGYVYGFTDGLGFVCQDFKSGETVWKERIGEMIKGAVLGVDNRLLLLNERNGLLAVVAASPDGWKEFGRMDFPERTKIETKDNMVWTHPVVADGKLFLRDHDLLFCFNLK